MEMMERVARAIFASGLPASWANDPAVFEEAWNAAKRDRETACTQARAAIAAMREPTDEMRAAGAESLIYPTVVMGGVGELSKRSAARHYRAMIDAALPAQSMAEIS